MHEILGHHHLHQSWRRTSSRLLATQEADVEEEVVEIAVSAISRDSLASELSDENHLRR